jgi:hypothetical protein
MEENYNPEDGTLIKIMVKMKGKQILSGIETYGFDGSIQDRMSIIGALENLKQQEIKKLNDLGSASKTGTINKDDL